MGEVFFMAYFDFEITFEKKFFEFDDIGKLYPVSYAFFIVLYPELKLDRICLDRCFCHTLYGLNDVSNLPDKMLCYSDPVTARQLRDCAKNVYG